MNKAAQLAILISALVALASCGTQGTLGLTLIFPPGTTRLPAAAVTLRATVSDPPDDPIVQSAPIAADGSFALDLSFDSRNDIAVVTIEALDAGGTVVARGVSAPESIDSSSDSIAVFMSPPSTFQISPSQPATALADIGVAPLGYGILLAGGRDAAGNRSAELDVYSIYTYTTTAGLALPTPRALVTAFADPYDLVYLFGGEETGDAATVDMLTFDTTAPPYGSYTTVTQTDTTLARAGSVAAALGNASYLFTGSPVLLFDSTTNSLAAFANSPGPAAMASSATTTISPTSGGAVVILSGPSGLYLYDAYADKWQALTGGTPRSEQAMALLPGGDVVTVGGLDATMTLLGSVDRTTAAGVVTSMDLLARPRRQAAAAVAGTVLVVAGGFDASGAALDDAELFDASTLAPLGTTPLNTPRGGAVASSQENNSILLVSGRVSDGGAPAGMIEIFTP